MKKNASDYLVALSVIACSLVLLGALTYGLGGWSPKGSGRFLEADFADVTGVKMHSEVRYVGAPAGRVTAIRYLTEEERRALPPEKQKNAVRVTIDLKEEVPMLPADLRVSLGADTLLSDKFVALTGGSTDAPRLANGSLLQGDPGGSIDELISAFGPFLRSADKAIAGIEPLLMKTSEAVDAVKTGINDVIPRIAGVAESLKQTSASGDALLKRADKLIADNEPTINADLVELRKTLLAMQDTLKTANGFVGRTDKHLDARMDELSVVLQNLKVATTHAKAFAQAIAEKPNRLIFSGKAKTMPEERAILRSSRPVEIRPVAPAKAR